MSALIKVFRRNRPLLTIFWHVIKVVQFSTCFLFNYLFMLYPGSLKVKMLSSDIQFRGKARLDRLDKKDLTIFSANTSFACKYLGLEVAFCSLLKAGLMPFVL